MSQLYYLNNRGSRWVILPKEKIVCNLPSGEKIRRTILIYESFGNFVCYQISYKGKKAFYLPNNDNTINIELNRHQ